MDSNTERRREHRILSREPVEVILLGAPGGAPISCTMLDISGSGLSVLSPRPIPGGVAVRVEGAYRSIVGEVIRSDPEGEGYNVGIKVGHALDRDESYIMGR